MIVSKTQTRPKGWIIAAAAAAAAVFLVDLLVPLGLAVPMLYVLPILLTWFVLSRWSTFLITGGALGLTWLGWLLSPGSFSSEVVANRAITSSLLIVVAWLLINLKGLTRRAVHVYEVLQESEERFRKIFQHSPIGIAIGDLDGRFVQCNPAYSTLTGYSEEELRGMTFHSLIHPDDYERDMSFLRDLKDNIMPSFEIDCRYRHKSGQPVWVHKFVSMLRSEQGSSTHFVRLITDISERKKGEEASKELNVTLEQRVRERASELVEANERFQWVVKATNDGVWDWDLLHRTTYFSPRWKEMHGFSVSNSEESADEWSARIHVEDRKRVLDRLQDYLAGRRHEFWEEYRISRKDGTSMWVLDRGVAIWNEQGRAVRMVGAETDITWRKETEETLRRREHVFKTLADNVPAFFGYIDRDCRYTFVNKQYERLFGRSNEKIVGQLMRELLGADGYAQVQPYLHKALDGEPVSFEYELTLPGTSTCHFSAHYVPDKDEQGHVVGLFALLSDVSALKSSEAALRKQEGQLRNLSTKLLHVQEEERRRIAQDLHDDYTQRLAALRLQLYQLSQSNDQLDPALTSSLKELGMSAEQLTTDLQQLAHRLHPSILEHAGLEVAVCEQVDEFSARTGLVTEVMVRDLPKDMPLEPALCLYRVLQESLQNVRKHAGASSVLVRLLRTGRGIGLCVHDDGQGFDDQDTHAQRKGLGLTSMAERVAALKGTLLVRSKSGIGTELHAWVPLDDRKVNG